MAHLNCFRPAHLFFITAVVNALPRQLTPPPPSPGRPNPSLQDASGIEGFEAEYWSPPPYWKSTQSYIGGSLASFNDSFLQDFADARVADINYLQQSGLKVPWWGLQNEPNFDSAKDGVSQKE